MHLPSSSDIKWYIDKFVSILEQKTQFEKDYGGSGIIAPMIAVTDSSIVAIVLMAGTATKGDDVFDFQQGTGWRGSGVAIRKWEELLIEYDPLPTAEMVRCPVLILHGDQDELVPVEHANILAEAIRRSGNQDVTGRQCYSIKNFTRCDQYHLRFDHF